jgi:hypothetical protein
MPIEGAVLFELHKLCAAGWWFSPGTSVSSTNKTDCQNITEVLLKVVLNTITVTLYLRI